MEITKNIYQRVHDKSDIPITFNAAPYPLDVLTRVLKDMNIPYEINSGPFLRMTIPAFWKTRPATPSSSESSDSEDGPPPQFM